MIVEKPAALGGWREVLLEDVADDVTVGYVGPMASEYVAEGIPFFRSQNVEPLRINESDLKFITPEFHEKLKKSALAPGDVMIVRTGKPGACAVVPAKFPVANCSDCVIVRCGRQLDPRFLAYYVNSVAINHVAAHLVGAVQQHFNVGSARKMLMRLPELAEQRVISDILSALDEKIELNRRMNEALEETLTAVFKSWFVGRVQKGWRESTIGNEVRVVGGSTPSTRKSEYWDGGSIFWATPKDLSALQSPVLLRTERRITENGLAQIGSGLLPRGTVLLSSRAPIGYLAISEVPVAVNQGFIAMVCDKSLPPFYALLWAEHNMEAIKGRANGTTFQEVSKANFRPMPITVPPPGILDRFVETASPLYHRIVQNLRESERLVMIRDALLPKLISGDLRINAEKAAAR